MLVLVGRELTCEKNKKKTYQYNNIEEISKKIEYEKDILPQQPTSREEAWIADSPQEKIDTRARTNVSISRTRTYLKKEQKKTLILVQ